MTYAEFLIVFILTPLIPMLVLSWYQRGKDYAFHWWGVTALGLMALVYTTPWDNYLVANNIWMYGLDRVLFVIGYVPIEEYSFFILQTLLTSTWCYLVLRTFKCHQKSSAKVYKHLTLLPLFFLLGLGLWCLWYPSTRYMGLILSWALPVLLLQFIVGGEYILANARVFLLSVLPPTFYLWFADAYAIGNGIWTISDHAIIGWHWGVLPVEEAVFFLMTNLMVGQGLILFHVMKQKIKWFEGWLDVDTGLVEK